jgi:hypothetical protein
VPLGGPLEEDGNVKSAITADEAVATVPYTNEDDADSTLCFQVRAATLYCRGQPAANHPEPNDRQA